MLPESSFRGVALTCNRLAHPYCSRRGRHSRRGCLCSHPAHRLDHHGNLHSTGKCTTSPQKQHNASNTSWYASDLHRKSLERRIGHSRVACPPISTCSGRESEIGVTDLPNHRRGLDRRLGIRPVGRFVDLPRRPPASCGLRTTAIVTQPSMKTDNFSPVDSRTKIWRACKGILQLTRHDVHSERFSYWGCDSSTSPLFATAVRSVCHWSSFQRDN